MELLWFVPFLLIVFSVVYPLIFPSTAVLSVTLFPLEWIKIWNESIYLSIGCKYLELVQLSKQQVALHSYQCDVIILLQKKNVQEGRQLFWYMVVFQYCFPSNLAFIFVLCPDSWNVAAAYQLAHALCSYLLLIQFVQLQTNISPLHPSSAIIRAGYYLCLTGSSLCMVDLLVL